MTIKEGYDGKPTHIKIYARENRQAEVWLEQEGVPRFAEVIVKDNVKEESMVYKKIEGHDETLAYATVEEIMALRDQCNDALRVLVGV